MKFVNFQRFALLMQNFIKLSLVTTEIYRNDNMTKFLKISVRKAQLGLI